MEKDSALYQLMDICINGVMNGIVSSDGEYQAILRKSDIYSGELDRMDLSKEVWLLTDRYVSGQKQPRFHLRIFFLRCICFRFCCPLHRNVYSLLLIIRVSVIITEFCLRVYTIRQKNPGTG